MASELGELIRARREEFSLTLRGLARSIGKSPSFVVEIERGRKAPSIAEDTLHEISRVLQLELDLLVLLAGKTPSDVAPTSTKDIKLYRMVRGLNDEQKEQLIEYLRGREND